uniref:Uncharacterized protein n=1 Tax=Anguilla anguilla TaxID=7936 RepID=A0A0E9XUX1_ANGAN
MGQTELGQCRRGHRVLNGQRHIFP